jgi:hypothetical protein
VRARRQSMSITDNREELVELAYAASWIDV